MRVLYHGGATLRAHEFPHVDRALRELLEKTGAEVVTIPDEKPMTDVLFNLGFREEARRVGEWVKREAEKLAPDVMVSPYAVTPFIWRKAFPEAFGLEMPFPVKHLTEYLWDTLGDKDVKFKEIPVKKVFLHHGCTVARQLGAYKEPRELLKRIPGLEVAEIDVPPVSVEGNDPGVWSTCTGAWLNMTLSEDLAAEVAANLMRREVVPSGADAVTTTCACAYKGLVQGVQHGGYEVKPYYYGELINMALEA